MQNEQDLNGVTKMVNLIFDAINDSVRVLPVMVCFRFAPFHLFRQIDCIISFVN